MEGYVSVDEGKSATSANQHSSSTDDRSEYMVEHGNGVTWLIALKIWEQSWQGLKTMAIQQDTSKQGYSLDPFSCGQKGLGSRLSRGQTQLDIGNDDQGNDFKCTVWKLPGRHMGATVWLQ